MKFSVRSRAEYHAGLRRLGSLTLWVTPEILDGWRAARRTTSGGQSVYSDLVIETGMMLRLAFHLTLRQTERLMASIFDLLDVPLSTPDHSAFSRAAGSISGHRRLSADRGAEATGPGHGGGGGLVAERSGGSASGPVDVFGRSRIHVPAGRGVTTRHFSARGPTGRQAAQGADRVGFCFAAHELGDTNRSARVERPFWFIETNFLAGRSFADWQGLNRQAREWCDRVNAGVPMDRSSSVGREDYVRKVLEGGSL